MHKTFPEIIPGSLIYMAIYGYIRFDFCVHLKGYLRYKTVHCHELSLDV